MMVNSDRLTLLRRDTASHHMIVSTSVHKKLDTCYAPSTIQKLSRGIDYTPIGVAVGLPRLGSGDCAGVAFLE